MFRRKTGPSGTSDLNHNPVHIDTNERQANSTGNVEGPEKLAEEVSVCPEIMVLQVCVKVVHEHLLFLSSLGLSEIGIQNGC